MDNFLSKFRAYSLQKNGIDGGEARRRDQLAAHSGGHVSFNYNPQISERYKDSINDAINFYQREFKVTPRAEIVHSPEELPKRAGGGTIMLPNSTGQYPIALRWLTRNDEREAGEVARSVAGSGWAPRGASDLTHVPLHEMGHALAFTLFDMDFSDEKKRADYIRRNDELVERALTDIGANSLDKQRKEMSKISGYASSGSGYDRNEVVAESLADYYYNKDKAAPLSKAIVKRLKREGGLYGLRQSGGVDVSSSKDNFYKNLRRYNPVQ